MSSERHRTRWAACAALPALVAALGAGAAPAGAQSTIAAQSDTLVFASTAAAAQPTPRDVFVINTSAASLASAAVNFGAPQYPAGAPVGWLTASKQLGSSIAAGATAKLGTLAITPGSLANGTYRASVAVNAVVNGVTSTDSIVVLLDVAGPTISLSTTAVSLTPTTLVPAPVVPVTVGNVGSTQMTGIVRGTIEYLSGSTTNWLNVNAGPGTTLNPGISGTYNLSLAKLDLPAGTYTARFPVSSANSTNGPLYVNVTLVQAGPTLAAEGATTIAITAPSNTTLPSSVPFVVRNVGTSHALNVRPGSITYEGSATGWLSATTSTSSELAPNGTRTVTLSTTSAHQLAPGTYRAHVPVLLNNGDNSAAPTADVTLTVGNPTMAVSTTSVTATANATSPTPANQSVSVSNAGSSMLRNVQRTIAYAAGEPTGWLSLFNTSWNLVAPGGSSAFSLSFAPSALPAGTYHATITITADLVAPQVVNVTLTRSGTEISVASSVEISSPQGGGAITRDVPVSNGGAGTLSGLAAGTITYAAGQPTGWITGAVMQSTTAPTNLRITANTAGLAAGTYNAVVPVLASGASNSPQTVAVSFIVAPARVFFGGIGTQSPQATVGGADPAPILVNVSNAGGAALAGMTLSTQYVSGAATGWLDATLEKPDAPARLTLQPRTGALAPGLYTARVTVAAPDATPLSLDVRFTVLDAPTIGFQLSGSNSTAPTHSATVTQGAAAPAPVTFVVRNVAGGTLNGLTVSSITYGTGEPTGWLTGTLAGTTAPANLTLTANHASLAAGTYTGKVWVSSPVASNGPQAITYTLTVKAAPVLALSRTSVTATSMAGTTPTSEAVIVSNSTGGAMSGIALSAVTYGAGEPTGWLTPALGSTSISAGGSTTATLGFASAALPAGVYHASVAVSSTDAINGPQTIDVTLTVTRRPAIALSTSAVPLSALVGGVTTAPAAVNVTNGGANTLSGLAIGTVDYAAGAAGWLDARISAATAPATVTLRATPAGLAAGTYTAVVPVISTNASTENSPQTITVTFTVTQQPILAFSEINPALTAQVGGAAVTRSVTVQNAGGGTLDGLAVQSVGYTSAATGWLQATLGGGTAPATLTLTATAGALPAGTYTANVLVASSAASNSPQVLPVTFTVTARPAIALGASTAGFTAVAGGASPAARTIGVSNAGAGTLDGLSVAVADADGELPTWLTASLGGTTAPATLTITPNTTGLAAGSYSATVTVASAVQGVAPRTVAVSLTVSEAPARVAFARPAVLLSIQVNALAARSQTVGIGNAGGGTLAGLAVAGITYDGARTGWMAASLGGTTAPATLTLRTQTRGVPVGYYTAALTVTGTGAVAGTLPVAVEVIDLKLAEAALTDATKLPDAERARLDQLGNADGDYNLGDYLALRARLGLN